MLFTHFFLLIKININEFMLMGKLGLTGRVFYNQGKSLNWDKIEFQAWKVLES